MKNIFKKVLPPVLVFVASIFIVNALVAAKPTPEKKPKEQRSVSLFVDEVIAQTVKLKVTTQGEVKPQTEIDLTAQVSGQVISVSQNFSEGSQFKVGSRLIKIDDTDYKLAVVRAQEQVASAKVAVEKELANSKIKKNQWKHKSPKVKPSDYALNIPQIAQARAQLNSAQAEFNAAKLNLSRTEIKAPFDGRVQNENIAIGQYITPATILGHIFSTDVVEVRLPLTDSQLTELNLPMGFVANQNNAPVVTFTANMGNDKQQWNGRIVRTNAAVDNQTRMIYAIAEVPKPYANKKTPMAVGLYVNAEINSHTDQNTLMFPRLALHGKDKVYVINDANKLEIRTVKVLSTSKDSVHVATGVKAGEKVVTSTVPVVVDGMDVIAISRTAETKLKVSQNETNVNSKATPKG
jgi:RND family efflux transporter MFP subunit